MRRTRARHELPATPHHPRNRALQLQFDGSCQRAAHLADTKLRRLEATGVFETNTSSLGVRRGRYLRAYVYRFIELCSPALKENLVRKALDQPPGR
jgi:hypothetical protein